MTDAEWSKAVRKRDFNTCRILLPGCTSKATDAHHIFTRKFKKLRCDIRNGLSVCRNCHNKLEGNYKLNEEICLSDSVMDKDTREFLLKVMLEYGYKKEAK